ncbi:MAG: hypothetical protein QCH35_04525 [Methanomicrobiaceae archaeon]|nr:hypothetical protein [Methanomicrobiaceae archaeon]
MKKFHAELNGFIEVDCDQQCDADILLERILDEVNEVFARHGGIQDCTIGVSSITEKALK